MSGWCQNVIDIENLTLYSVIIRFCYMVYLTIIMTANVDICVYIIGLWFFLQANQSIISNVPNVELSA